MRQNPERRKALLDAAVEVLAGEGSRGLTFRAIDAQAEVPAGTTSNYFANRDTLLMQVAARITERVSPVEADLAETMKAPPSLELFIALMRELHARMRRDRSAYLAGLEIRLEATRSPQLHALLNEAYTSNLQDGLRFHRESGIPGDDAMVVMLFLAMTGLIMEDLTFPDVLAQYPLDELIATLVTRAQPDTDESAPA